MKHLRIERFRAAFGEHEDHTVDPEPDTPFQPIGKQQSERPIHDKELLGLNASRNTAREALSAPEFDPDLGLKPTGQLRMRKIYLLTSLEKLLEALPRCQSVPEQVETEGEDRMHHRLGVVEGDVASTSTETLVFTSNWSETMAFHVDFRGVLVLLDGLFSLEVHFLERTCCEAADESPAEHLLIIHVLQQMLHVIDHGPQVVLRGCHQTHIVIILHLNAILLYHAIFLPIPGVEMIIQTACRGCHNARNNCVLSPKTASRACFRPCSRSWLLWDRQIRPSKSVSAKKGASRNTLSAIFGWNLPFLALNPPEKVTLRP